MRYLGVDVGTKTVGVAVSDKTNSLSTPVKVIRFKDINEAVIEVVDIITEYQVSDIVIGLPKNMDNSLGFASSRSLKFKELLEKQINQNIHLIDERLSTIEAEKILINNRKRREKRKKQIDAVAAVLILDTFLRLKGEN